MAFTQIIKRTAFILYLIFMPGIIYSQVTIGSSEPPASGSLLQLKNITGINGGSANATKGLNLPRVKINDLGKLQLGDKEELDDKEAHIGLLVYNVNVIETAENRICEGLHMWNGSRWQPVNPYPAIPEAGSGGGGNFIIIDVRREVLNKELYNDPVNYPIGPLGKYTDVRGPNGEEVNEYYIARFYAAKVTEKVITTYRGRSAYSCNPAAPYSGDTWTEEETIERIEDGIWMCENMRTKFAPNAESTPIPYFHYTVGDGYNLAYWGYPGTYPGEAQIGPDAEGLVYNWAAATMGADGIHGKGGETGKGNNYDSNGDCIDERALWHKTVQGICPQGWHLPSMKDYDMLRDAMLADPSLYSTDANLTTEHEIGKAFKHPSTLYTGSNNGTSKEAWEGGFAAYLTAGWTGDPYEYGLAGHIWNSSNINTGSACVRAGQYSVYAEHSWAGLDYSFRYVSAAVRCMKY